MNTTHTLAPSKLTIEGMQQAQRVSYWGTVAILIALLGAAIWAACAPLNGAVIASGAVKVDSNRKTVQHQEGGIVKVVHVRDGDRVEAGQALITLDDARVSAGFESLRTQLDSERAKLARLSAESSFSGHIAFDTDLAVRVSDPRVAQLLVRERALFHARREALDSQIHMLRQQSLDVNAEIDARSKQRSADARQVGFQEQELEANRALAEQGFVSKTRLLTLQRALAEYQGKHSENEAETSRARQKLAELNLQATAVRNDYMQKAADALKESTARVFDLEERLRAAEDASQRQVIAAPIAGVVVNMESMATGTAIAPRQALLDIVPKDADLVVESRIRPEDINNVKRGAEADVRLTSFKSRITPIVTGEVVYVAADSITDQTKNIAYYVARVRVSGEALRAAGDLRLQPGMPAEVFIKTGARTPLEYMLDPALAFLRRAFREP